MTKTNKFNYWSKHILYKVLGTIAPKLFLKFQVKRLDGYWPNLKNPKTFNEKLNWYKLFYHDPKMPRCADKYELRNYLKEKGLEQYQNEVYGVYDDVDDIDFDKFPTSFVLKSTHGSAQTIICKDKSELNIQETKKELKFWLKTNQYDSGCEWVYKNITPRIICEELIKTIDGQSPKDYKFFCFYGEPKFILLCSGRIDGHEKLDLDFYDMNWNHIPVMQGFPNSTTVFSKPQELDEAIDICRRVSKDFPHVRVDMYFENGKIMISELTFYHFNGYGRFVPRSYDELFGSYFELPAKTH